MRPVGSGEVRLEGRANRAVVIVHGIGKQQRGAAREGLVRALIGQGSQERVHPAGAAPRLADRPDAGQEERAGQEARTLMAPGEGPAVDVYEVYWAPLLAGRTTSRAVLAWLLGATFLPARAIRRASRKTVTDLLQFVGLLTLAGYAALWSVGAVGGLLAQADCAGPDGCPSEVAEARDQTGLRDSALARAQLRPGAVVAALRAATPPLGQPLGDYRMASITGLLSDVGTEGWIALAFVIFVAAQLGYRLLQLVVGPPRPFQALLAVGLAALLAALVPLLDPLLVALGVVLLVAGLLTRLARVLLAEILGDVAVYVQKDENSADFRARQAVIGTCEDVLGQVAAAGYTEIVVLAHSLGAVIAYDALTGLGRRGSPVNQRVVALVTFGSALEKVRYFFDRKADDSAQRTADVAAGFAAFRASPVPWLNLWYWTDVVANPITTFVTPSARVDLRGAHAPEEVLAAARGAKVVNLGFAAPLLGRNLGRLLTGHVLYLNDPRVAAQLAAVVFAPMVALGVTRVTGAPATEQVMG